MDKLDELEVDERYIFTATVDSFCTFFNDYSHKDELWVYLRDIKTNGAIILDRTCFTVGKQLAAVQLQCGDVIQFSARVGWTPYVPKYWKPWEKEYYKTLLYPTKIRKLTQQEARKKS